VEHVRARDEPQRGRDLRREHAPARRALVEVERLVGLRVQPAPVEDDEARIDAGAALRGGVRPGDAGDVDRAMRDAERAPRFARRLRAPRLARPIVFFGHLWIDCHEVGTDSTPSSP
jgi:hypothetical protein